MSLGNVRDTRGQQVVSIDEIESARKLDSKLMIIVVRCSHTGKEREGEGGPKTSVK